MFCFKQHKDKYNSAVWSFEQHLLTTRSKFSRKDHVKYCWTPCSFFSIYYSYSWTGVILQHIGWALMLGRNNSRFDSYVRYYWQEVFELRGKTGIKVSALHVSRSISLDHKKGLQITNWPVRPTVMWWLEMC